MFTNSQCDKELKDVSNFLDSIDLLSEMINEENIYDFMNRLSDKYPYSSDNSTSLFDCVSDYEFADYLHERYGISCTHEEMQTFILKPRDERSL